MPPPAVRPVAMHALVAAAFVVLALVWSYPLVARLGTDLPGASLGDNAHFLWDFWWMRTALHEGVSFFFTPYLFAPVGADLTLHSHAALPALVGATIFGRWPTVAAFNATTLAALALNGFAAYLLAWRVARHRGGAILAGVIFGTSPYLAAHLNGHINLVNAWPLPLFALTFVDAVGGRRRSAVLAGLVLGVTAYVDYYYAVYELVFALGTVLLACTEVRLERRTEPRRHAWLLPLVYTAIAVTVVLLAAIGVSGGADGRVGPLRFSAHGLFNLFQVLWPLAALAAWLQFGRRLHVRRSEGGRPVDAFASLGVTALVSTVVAAPLVWGSLQLFARGQYVSQQYVWRNAPVGNDLLTLLAGDPFNGLWGGPISRAYSGMRIDLIESGAWLGVVPVALAAYALARTSWSTVRTWAWMAGGFFVWSLGSHVHAAGTNIGLLTPAVLVRYIPIVANARMPGRAIVMTHLGLAVLAAIGISSAPWRRRGVAVGILGLIVLADFMVAPFPTVSAEAAAIYRVVRDRPEAGALAELPLGVGDGFRDLTAIDHSTFVSQAVHGRRVVGGVVARLAPETLDAYRRDPLLAAWLRLSGMRGLEHVPLPDAEHALAQMRTDGIGLVMLNRRRASAELRQYVEHDLPVRIVAEDGDRALYVLR